ncbi:Jerky protein-like-like [Holothuria leucospilota]|uniref:Jerky protein-like-like n=1 Tax=Holothuria leucospilota TaxID=206669 RepID=A0A9Q1HKK4_HOLLE|nr:Jerky protein-like-like [Holothuria leucospilota]
MKRAYVLVTADKMSIRKAAWQCGVPIQTLRDRLERGVNQARPLGGDPLLSRSEEEGLVKHIEYLAKCGYPLTRKDVINLATETAIFLKKRPQNAGNLSKRWFVRFMSRWPELRLAKAQKLSMKRAKATSDETVQSYFQELDRILTKYDIKNKPHLIYNVDETGFQMEHTPSKVVGPRGLKLNAITSERGPTTTLLACGNAVGTCLPPYFVFKGARYDARLMAGAVPGSKCSMSKSGWSNGNIFKHFLEEHFIPFLPQRKPDDHVLLLYDGHTSHISIPLIELAKEHKIILFVLPPHTSHVLQPLDVGLFKPLKTFQNACGARMRESPGEVITRYDVCNLASKSFLKAFTPINFINSFRKTGIFPFNPQEIDQTMFEPAKNLARNHWQTEGEEESVEKGNMEKLNQFFSSRLPTPKEPKSHPKKRKVSYRPGGVAITEETIILKIRKVYADGDDAHIHPDNSLGEVSGEGRKRANVTQEESDSDDETDDVCCVCNKFSPDGLNKLNYLKIVDWAQCDLCNHWVHLEFCDRRNVNDIRSGPYRCIHCVSLEE